MQYDSEKSCLCLTKGLTYETQKKKIFIIQICFIVIKYKYNSQPQRSCFCFTKQYKVRNTEKCIDIYDTCIVKMLAQGKNHKDFSLFKIFSCDIKINNNNNS